MPPRAVRPLLHPAVGLLILAVILAAFATLPVSSQDQPVQSTSGGESTAGGSESMFGVFYKTGLDTSKAYAVSSLSLQKDSVTLLLKQGTIFLMQPISGEVTGAVFVGDGVATTTPPNGMERYMLRKYSGADTLNESFTEAIFRFSDGSHKKMVVEGRPASPDQAQVAHASQIWSERNVWLDNTRSLQLEMQLLEMRVSGIKDQDFFLADLHTPKHEWLTYRYNPMEIHENELFASESLGSKGKRYEVAWMSWHSQTAYSPNGHYILNPDRAGPRLFRVKHYDMTLDLPTTKTVQWQAHMTVEPLVDGLRGLKFDLVNNANFAGRWYEDNFYPARVRSVVDLNGQPLPFLHKKDQLFVFLSRSVAAGENVDLVVTGSADMVYQVTAESFGLAEAPWYPQYGFVGGRSSFHWTVRVPQPFLITGSGKILREFEDKEKGQNGIETVCELPISFPWVIFGRFQKAERSYVGEESKKIVPVTLHSFPSMTETITDKNELERIGSSVPVTFTLNAPIGKVTAILDEVVQILKLYEKIYGPYPYDQLHIAQMGPFLGFGQSPQGFVQLTGDAFLSQSEISRMLERQRAGRQRERADYLHGFISHEVAHQWWGHQIGPASDDDVWISEGFAEYAAGIFVKEYQGANRFQQKLDEWKHSARIGDQDAPIAAASTLRGPNAGSQRESLVYFKSAYVVHMLRVELGDTDYVKVMRGLQEKFRNHNISTELLLSEVNRISGKNFTPFFDQWVWGVGIPTFRYSWRSERQTDGKYLISVHVSQDDKANFKRVLMPVYIQIKGKTIAPQYLRVDKPDQDLKILSPENPKDVTLDDEHTLLADVVKAG